MPGPHHLGGVMARLRLPIVSLVLLFSILALLTVTSPSFAELVTWGVHASFIEGGDLSGTFVYDTSSTVNPVPTWSIVVNAVGVPTDVEHPVLFSEAGPSAGAEIHGPFEAIPPYPGPYTYISFGQDQSGEPGIGHRLEMAFGGSQEILGVPGSVLLWRATYYVHDGTGGGEIVTTYYGLGDGGLSQVPIPPSSLLFGAGLIGLAWARRKQRLGQ
jgi:hypothetical protein